MSIDKTLRKKIEQQGSEVQGEEHKSGFPQAGSSYLTQIERIDAFLAKPNLADSARQMLQQKRDELISGSPYVEQLQDQSVSQGATDGETFLDFQLSSDASNSQSIIVNKSISSHSSTFQSVNTVQGTMTYSGTNSRLLLAGLTEYRNSLERHLGQLTSEYQQLEGRWRAFNSVSEGDYADQFRAGWMQTEARFRAYINQSQKIKALLNERISALEVLNRQESGLL